ncbi:unnamed protein product, partial [Iphiclides podalirius]
MSRGGGRCGVAGAGGVASRLSRQSPTRRAATRAYHAPSFPNTFARTKRSVASAPDAKCKRFTFSDHPQPWLSRFSSCLRYCGIVSASHVAGASIGMGERRLRREQRNCA